MRLAWALVTALAVTTAARAARADAAAAIARATARRAAEQLERDAIASKDRAAFVACGDAYLAMYNADPANRDAPEVLYNAGICYGEARSVGAAIQAFRLVRTQHASSPLAARALARDARWLAQIGSYREAAELLEAYARRYAGEPDAPAALGDAIAYRTATGDDARAIAGAELMVRLFGAHRPDEAAAALLAVAPHHERRGVDAGIAHLRAYLRQLGAKAGPARVIGVQARLGELLWRKSCPVAMVDGVCGKLARPPLVRRGRGAQPSRCAGVGDPRLALVARDPVLVKEAQAALQAAVALFERGAPTDPAARAAYGSALATLADADFETYLAVPFPAGDLSQRAGIKRFQDWLLDKRKLAAAAQQRYERIVGAGPPGPASVIAVARVGQISQVLATELLGAEIPKSLRAGKHAQDVVAVYCEKLTEVADGLAQTAIAAFDQCLARAAGLGIDDGWARLCAYERGRLDPARATPQELALAPGAPRLPVVIAGARAAAPRDPPELRDALAKLAQADRGTWTDAACRASAARFTAAAAQAGAAAPAAHYMAGLSYHRCGLAALAQRAYEQARDHAPAHANLGELRWRAGDRAGAKQAWEAAVAADAKLPAARTNLAALALHELRALPAGDARRAALAQDARHQLASALAVSDDALPHVLLAALHDALGEPRLAAFHVDQAARRDAPHPAVQAALGLAAARGGRWLDARDHLERANQLAPTPEGQLDLAITYLRLRRHADAAKLLAAIAPASYELHVARGIAARGLGDFAAAEAAYHRAIALDGRRADALYDLGVLHSHAAAIAPDVRAAALAFGKAADAFRRAAAADPGLDAARLATEADLASRAIDRP